MTRSVLTALTAGLMIGGGLLFAGGITAGVLWMSDPGPIQTATIPMPPPPQASFSPGVTVDPEPKPERPQVFVPPPAPPEPDPPPMMAHPVPPATPTAPIATAPAPPAPLKPSDLDAKPPQSILSMLLKPVPPAEPEAAPPAPLVPSRQSVPSVLDSALPARPQVSAAMPVKAPAAPPPQQTAALPSAAPAPVPSPAPAKAQPTTAEPEKPQPARPQPAKPQPVKAEAPAKPVSKADPKPEPKPEPKPAPKEKDTATTAQPLTVQWKDGTTGPTVGRVDNLPPQQAPSPQAPTAPQGMAQQASVMDALTLPQAPVGSRVEVAADGQRQTVTTRGSTSHSASKPTAAPGTVAIRSGVFAQEENVRSRLAELKAIGLSGSVYSFTNNAGKTMKVVEVGRYPSRKAAASVIAKLKAHKLEVYVADPP